MYKQAILHKLDNILNNAEGINEDDRAWIEAFVGNGLDAQHELDQLKWERDNKL